jgi:hypothetical protein
LHPKKDRKMHEIGGIYCSVYGSSDKSNMLLEDFSNQHPTMPSITGNDGNSIGTHGFLVILGMI